MFSLRIVVFFTLCAIALGQYYSGQHQNGQVYSNDRYAHKFRPAQISRAYTEEIRPIQPRPYGMRVPRIITYSKPIWSIANIEQVEPQPVQPAEDQDANEEEEEEPETVPLKMDDLPSLSPPSSAPSAPPSRPSPPPPASPSKRESDPDNSPIYNIRRKDNLKAIAVLRGKAKGILYFEQIADKVHVTGTIEGLSNGLHAFHVHHYGDLSRACMSSGDHFNPYNTKHGSPFDATRHVGDLGNVFADESEVAKVDIMDKFISLREGPNNIIGHAVNVHENVDNLGRGGHIKSGPAIGCGIIGWRNAES